MKAASDELPWIGKPATSALAAIGVTTRAQIARYTEAELLAMHGIGPKAIALLRAAGVKLKR